MTLVKFANSQKNGTMKSSYSDIFSTLFNQEPYFYKNLGSGTPAVNVAETETEFHIELAIPGVKKENFKINIEKDQLNVSAEQEKEDAENTVLKKYSRKEFNYTSFSRTFTLPESADQNNILAEYTDGVLFVTIGKKEEAKIQSRVISVK